MAKQLRNNLIPATLNASGKVEADLKAAKDVSWNFMTKDLSVNNMDKDQFISIFVSMKNDCIVYQQLFNELILKQAPFQIDNHIIEFDRKYREIDLGLTVEHKIKQILELYSVREKYLWRIFSSLLEQSLGHEHVIRQNKTQAKTLESCSDEVVDLISFCRTFRK